MSNQISNTDGAQSVGVFASKDLFLRPVLNLCLTCAHVAGNVVTYEYNITQ